MGYKRGKIVYYFRKYFIEMMYLTLGCILIAFATTSFLLPNKLSSGGFTGITTILFYFFNIPIAVSMLLLNVPLYIFAFFKIGKPLFFKSVLGIVILSFFLEVFQSMGTHIVLTTDRLLAGIYGGVFVGIGTAFVLKVSASTGGTDMLSYVIKMYNKNVSTSKAITMIDIAIIVVNVIVFKEIEIGLYSAIAIYILGKIIDIIFEGIDFTKVLYIISDEHEEIARQVSLRVGRGSTGLVSRGMYTEQDKTMLLCVASRNEVALIKQIALKVDNKSFIIISNAREVFGKGFKREEFI
ncbi:MAG: YitT family protein [Clostridia bacterium]|nr:YitT family protein [Clostridia bacterium]